MTKLRFRDFLRDVYKQEYPDSPDELTRLLPYHGLGSGIKRALEQWPAIDFADNHDGCLY